MPQISVSACICHGWGSSLALTMVVEWGFVDGVVSTEVLRDDVAFLMNLPFGARSGRADGFLLGERVGRRSKSVGWSVIVRFDIYRRCWAAEAVVIWCGRRANV